MNSIYVMKTLTIDVMWALHCSAGVMEDHFCTNKNKNTSKNLKENCVDDFNQQHDNMPTTAASNNNNYNNIEVERQARLISNTPQNRWCCWYWWRQRWQGDVGGSCDDGADMIDIYAGWAFV